MKPFNSSTLLRPLTDAELQLEAPEWEDDDIMLGAARVCPVFIARRGNKGWIGKF